MKLDGWDVVQIHWSCGEGIVTPFPLPVAAGSNDG